VLLLLAAVLQGARLPLARLPWLVLALVGVGLSSGLLERAATGAAQGAWQGMVLALRGQAVFSPQAWGAVAVLGLVHTAWMYTLMYTAFQRLPAQAIAGLSFIYPVVALLVDVLWFGARPQLSQWLGMALILGALWAYRRSPRPV